MLKIVEVMEVIGKPKNEEEHFCILEILKKIMIPVLLKLSRYFDSLFFSP
jgi:hypothetical protein